MALKYQHDTIDEIPETYRDLYTEREGKYVLTGIAGVKTEADINRLTGSLEKERNDRKAAAEALNGWTGLGFEKPEEVAAKLDRFKELEIAATGNKEQMDAQLEELTEARVASRLAPVERQVSTITKERDSLLEEVNSLRAEKRQRIIHDNVLSRAIDAKVLPDVHQDVKLLADTVFDVTDDGDLITKENQYGVPPGLSTELFFEEMKEKRSYWWAPNSGGDAAGSRGGTKFANNPWSKDNWNLTHQGQVVKEHGLDRAKAMAQAAGTVLHGPRPV